MLESAMPSVRQSDVLRILRLSVGLTVVATFAHLAADRTVIRSNVNLALGESYSGIVEQFTGQDQQRRGALQEVARTDSHESESPDSALRGHDDPALRRGAMRLVAHGRNAASYCDLLKSCFSRRFVDCSLATPSTCPLACRRQFNIDLLSSWPMGHSATESVVNLRRLLI